MKKDLLEVLSGRALLGDGATGTQLQTMGLAPGQGGELWNLEQPDKVRELHRRYLAAGADLITTNTFGGTRLVLANHGLAERTVEINRAAAALAAEMAGGSAWVLGDVGPCGGILEPFGDLLPEVALEAFREQAAALLAGGADAILIETMSDPAEVELAVQGAREAGARCILATYAFQRSAVGFRTMMGNSAAEAMARAVAAGAQVVGANCGTELSLDDYERLTAELVAGASGRPVIVQPNAGSPVLENGRISYRESAGMFAEAAPRLRAAGARIVGGCCGSTPEHIAAVAAVLGR